MGIRRERQDSLPLELTRARHREERVVPVGTDRDVADVPVGDVAGAIGVEHVEVVGDVV